MFLKIPALYQSQEWKAPECNLFLLVVDDQLLYPDSEQGWVISPHGIMPDGFRMTACPKPIASDEFTERMHGQTLVDVIQSLPLPLEKSPDDVLIRTILCRTFVSSMNASLSKGV